jgi:hypothetical protein
MEPCTRTPINRSNNTFLVIILGIIFWYLITPNNPVDPILKSETSPYDSFERQITKLMQEFPKQQKRSWTIVKASTIHVWREAHSDYPVVLLVASPFRQASVSRRLGKKIAAAFELAKGMTPEESVADVGELQHFDTAAQKLGLDNTLNTVFAIKKRKSVVIDNLQAIDPNAAQLLHKYCDNYSPHKDVMIVLMLYYREKDFVDVDNYLEMLWRTGLESDKLNALLSRVANNVVMVEA